MKYDEFERDLVENSSSSIKRWLILDYDKRGKYM